MVRYYVDVVEDVPNYLTDERAERPPQLRSIYLPRIPQRLHHLCIQHPH